MAPLTQCAHYFDDLLHRALGLAVIARESPWCTALQSQVEPTQEKISMKMIALALIALSVVVGLVAPASALDDGKTFWQQHEENGGGG